MLLDFTNISDTKIDFFQAALHEREQLDATVTNCELIYQL